VNELLNVAIAKMREGLRRLNVADAGLKTCMALAKSEEVRR
jgi:hypothetical protein